MIQIPNNCMLILGMVFLFVTSICVESPAQSITENSYKYVDDNGNIQFASSYNAVPKQYQHPRHMSHSIEQEADAHTQTIQLKDIDGDSKQEILVSIQTIYPNGRMFDILEVIKKVSTYYVKFVTASADRGMKVKVLDVNQDGRYELYGSHHGGQSEFWIWDDGRYVNIITEQYWTYYGEAFSRSAEKNLIAALNTLYQQWLYDHFTRYKE